MFSVEWAINRGKEPHGVVQKEVSKSDSLAAVIASAKARLGKMKAMHPDDPPDGFVVLDASGKEVSRWFPVNHSRP